VLRSSLWLILILSVSAAPMTPTGSHLKTCVKTSVYAGGCAEITPEIKEETVDLSGRGGQPGNDPPPSKPAPQPGSQTGGSPPPPSPPPAALAPADPLAPVPVCSPEAYYDCFEIIEPAEPVAAVTLDDLASFRPVLDAAQMEPTGWSVAGLPTNFWFESSSHVVNGELFGRPASVRFTPAAAQFNYGDGSPAVRTPLGSSWAAAGAPEFKPTTTSHIYTNTGVYEVNAGVEFTVEYSYDGSVWIPVEGTLDSASPPLTAQVVHANTVLVNSDCAADPAGIGC
jgi:hypothetical protein